MNEQAMMERLEALERGQASSSTPQTRWMCKT